MSVSVDNNSPSAEASLSAADLVFIARNPDKLEEVLAAIRAAYPGARR
jgi:pyrroline-5-carboxylate reductase